MTAARAEAMFASRVAVLIVAVVEEDVDFVSLDALLSREALDSPDALRVSPELLVDGVVVVPVRVWGVVVVGVVLVVVGVVEVPVP